MNIFVFELPAQIQDKLSIKLEKIMKHFVSMETDATLEELVQRGMDGKVCDLEEVINVRLLLETGAVKGNAALFA